MDSVECSKRIQDYETLMVEQMEVIKLTLETIESYKRENELLYQGYVVIRELIDIRLTPEEQQTPIIMEIRKMVDKILETQKLNP